MNKSKSKLVALIRKHGLKRGNVTLASGISSDFYVDMKNILLLPQGINIISQMILEFLKNKTVIGIGGTSLGAMPISVGVSIMSLKEFDHPLKAFFIRKELKTHGMKRWVEGLDNFKKGDKVWIMEDVVTTGGSSLHAVSKARDAGLSVSGIITCVDRKEGGGDLIVSRGLEYLPLITKSDLV